MCTADDLYGEYVVDLTVVGESGKDVSNGMFP